MAHGNALQATAGFYGDSALVRLLRGLLATSQALAPALAVRVAGRLFCTPLPPKWLHRRHGLGPRWRREAWAFEGGDLVLHMPAAAPPGPVVVLAHGWGGHAGQMLALAEALAQHGLRPVLLELPAHGASRGWQSTLPQFSRAIEYVALRLAQEGHHLRALVAHSLGASAAAHAASRGLPLDRLVLLAPPASPRDYTRYFAHVFGLSEATRAGMQRRLEAREGMLMAQFEPAAVAPRLAMPLLVVHDRGDAINRFADGEAFARGARRGELLATEGLGHRKLLKDARVLGRVALFLRD